MKKRILYPILVVALMILLVPAGASATALGTPTIDGVLAEGEWDDALWFDETLDNTFTNPANMLIHIYVTNDAENLYIALDIPDTFDMRTHPEAAEGGSDTFALNIGVEGEGRSYSRILQFNTAAYEGGPQRVGWTELDGYLALWSEATSPNNTSKWGPTVENLPVPAGVQSMTTINENGRVQEIAIPLSDLGVVPGTELRIGGCIRAAEYEGYNFHALYPTGLIWGEGGTYQSYTLSVPPAPVRAYDAFDVFVRFGYDSTRYIGGKLAGSIEAAGTYNDAQYMLYIPAGCKIDGPVRINWMWFSNIEGNTLSFVLEGDAVFSLPCTLFLCKGGSLYQDQFTGEWLGSGTWVEVGTFSSIVGGEAHLD